MSNRSYEELLTFDSFDERLKYLTIGDNNIKSPRHMSLPFYKSKLWRSLRESILQRDLGFDLGVFGVYIDGPMYVHHINPIEEYDIINMTSKLTDPNNLITTSDNTHKKIHYVKQEIEEPWVERTPGDTIFW